MEYVEIERDVSLVDFLAKKLGCVFISDLKHLTADQQKHLASLLEQLPPKAASKAGKGNTNTTSKKRRKKR